MSERLDDVISDLEHREGASAQRVVRLALALREELRLLGVRLDGIDPVTVAATGIRPMADVERDAILHAVRTLGNASTAAEALGLGPATVYRKLRIYASAGIAVPETVDRRKPLSRSWPRDEHGHILPSERAPDTFATPNPRSTS